MAKKKKKAKNALKKDGNIGDYTETFGPNEEDGNVEAMIRKEDQLNAVKAQKEALIAQVAQVQNASVSPMAAGGAHAASPGGSARLTERMKNKSELASAMKAASELEKRLEDDEATRKRESML